MIVAKCKKFIEIVEYETGEVAERRDVSDRSDRAIEQIMSGMEINMSHKFYTRAVSEPEQDK